MAWGWLPEQARDMLDVLAVRLLGNLHGARAHMRAPAALPVISVCGACAQGGDDDAGGSDGALTLEEHVAAVQTQCTAMAHFMQTQRELGAMHRQRTEALCGDLSWFAGVLQESFANAETSYVAANVPERPCECTDLAALCAYVCDMLQFIVTLGCTCPGASQIEHVRHSVHEAARLSAQLPCAMDQHEVRFAVACMFAVVHQIKIPVDDMLQKTLARAGDAQTCDDAWLDALMRPSRPLVESLTDRFKALEERYEEEQAPDLCGFARLSIRKEAWSAFDGDCVQELITLLGHLQHGHAVVRTALAQAAAACVLDAHFAPHTQKRLTYARLHEGFLETAQAAFRREHEEWAATVRHANTVQRAARRAMLICQSAFERGSLHTTCDPQEPFEFVEHNIPTLFAHHHKGPICDLLARCAVSEYANCQAGRK
jgi:hypothetical protein